MENATPIPEKLLDAAKPTEILRDKKGRIVKGVAQDTNKNDTAGRPTKYDPKFVDEVYAYLKDMSMNTKEFPTMEGFAGRIKVTVESLERWCNKREKDEKGNKTKKPLLPEFCRAIKALKDEQRRRIIVDGFYGGKNVNATMGIFLLKVNHGMVETEHIDHTSKGQKLEAMPILGGGANVPTDDSNK